MKNPTYCILVILMFTSSSGCSKNSENTHQPEPQPVAFDFFYKAVDASYIPQIRASGAVTFSTSGSPEDMLTTLQKAGVNTIRLRLWHTPAGGHSGLDEVNRLATEIRRAGMKVWLTIHYSDSWADPQKQIKPKAWKNLTYTTLKDSLYNYTKHVTAILKPDLVQIGNEINNGIVWPEGSATNTNQYIELITTGISAARAGWPESKVMLHVAGPDDADEVLKLFQNADFDLIGLSYYPIWHGKNLLQTEATLYDLHHRYSKPVVIAETSYPFTLGWNDHTNNIIGMANQILPDFDPNPMGQRDFLLYIHTMMKRLGNVSGYCYWGGEWIAFKGPEATDGSSWENQALWDFDGKPLPALEVFGK